MSGGKAQAINRAWEKWPHLDAEQVAELVSAGWDAAKRDAAKVLRAPAEWLGGHCKYELLRHEDCPGHRGSDPCICQCHKSTTSEATS